MVNKLYRKGLIKLVIKFMLEFIVILKIQPSTSLIISRNFLMKSILYFIKSKKFSLGPNLENLDDFFKFAL